ncbi:MAG: hypothetical protein J6F33_12265, partial [Acidaminococcaceae bacterium]|nr:hypothetical protein [Acidaminococcaceae bacterium]
MELAALCPKQQRVFRIQAEHDAHAKLVQAFQRFFAGRVFVLGQHQIVQLPYQLACLYGKLLLHRDLFHAGVQQKRKQMIFFRQLFQQNA